MYKTYWILNSSLKNKFAKFHLQGVRIDRPSILIKILLPKKKKNISKSLKSNIFEYIFFYYFIEFLEKSMYVYL